MASDQLRYAKLPLRQGSGKLPALGFGTLIPDAAAARIPVEAALETGFRHFDCAERYRNEETVGDALRRGLARVGVKREEVFVTTKLWTTIIVPNGSRRRSTQAGGGSSSTMSISILFTRPSPSRPATTRIRRIRMAR
jgi:diketogulonate reductase-like aldo/keto reductase